MKRIVVASDSFKGCLSSIEVGTAAARGVHSVFPECHVRIVDIADGGEGTVGALSHALSAGNVPVVVPGPLMQPVQAVYALSADGQTAVMEMAAAAGLPLLPDSERNPLRTTTFGVGQMILHAVRSGCRHIVLGIGGSATNDAGLGMLRALGFRFYDSAGSEIAEPGRGEDLGRVARIDSTDVIPEVIATRFTAICDVNKPFCGPNGAAHIFGPQKGADTAMVERLDRGMFNFAQAIVRSGRMDITEMPGAGAAGGLGGAMAAFLGADLRPGIDVVLDMIGFDGMLEGADLVITGEGRMDRQTAMGKAPAGVLSRARALNVPVVGITGAVSDTEALLRAGFAAVFPIQCAPVSLQQAMNPRYAADNISRTVQQICLLFQK